MNMGNLTGSAISNALPPAPPEPRKAPEPVASKDPHAQDRDFEKALHQELDRNKGVPLPLPLPWQLLQAQQVPTEKEEETVEAASGLGGVGQSGAALMRSPLSMPRPVSLAQDGELEVAPVQEREPRQVSEVQVLVEPGLPAIQPLQPVQGEAQPVHIVEFPQVVTGTVQQMVKDNQPITQLDFEISPPHIGPVNLQVSLQNGAVNVQLVALTMQAKQALDNQVANISSILQAHHFTPGQIKVVTAAGGKAGAGSAGQKGEQPGFNFFSGGRRRSAAEQESMSVGRT